MARHPDFETLVRWSGGELPTEKLAEIAAHVSRCPECGLEADRLRAANEAGAAAFGATGAVPGPEHLEQILSRIRDWAKASEPEKVRARRRVAEMLSPYFGSAGAWQVVQPLREGSGELLGSIEPVLATFLGEKAAAKLMTDIVDAVLQETS